MKDRLNTRRIRFKLHLKQIIYGMCMGLFLSTVYFISQVPKTQIDKFTASVKYAVAMATTRMPETFTELYFENHNNLAAKIVRWRQYTFAFTIHNLEYKDMDYPYIVYIQRGKEKTIINQGLITLKHDEYKTPEETVGPFKNLRTKVVIELVNKNQSIAFWMEK